jgi:hypothetical protein
LFLSRSIPKAALLLSLICSALILAGTLTYPFNNDNALFAYMAALLIEGKLPYLESWDQNFPGVLLVHAPQILLFGRSQLAFHFWDVALQLLGSYYLFRLGLRFGGREAAVLAPILGALYYLHQGLWMAGERDTYVSILLLAALFFATSNGTIRRGWLLAGVLLGLAILFRPTYGLVVLPFGAYVWLVDRKVKSVLRHWLGVAFPLILVGMAYLLAGDLDEFYEATIRFNTEIYIGQGSVFSIWEPIRFYTPLSPFAVVGLWWLWKRDSQSAILLLFSLVACAASLLMLYRHSVYHYHPAMTIFLLISAVGIAKCIQWLTERARSRGLRISIRVGTIAFVMVFFGLQAVRGNTIKTVLSDIYLGRIRSLADSYDRFEGSPEFGVKVQQQVGEYLADRTEQGAAVQMFGPYSYPQYYSHTTTASRFQTLHALTMRSEDRELTPMQIAWRREYLQDLARVRPEYFIVCDAPGAFRQFYAGRLGHEILRDDMTEVGEWLSANYTVDTTIGAFTIYAPSAH